MTLLLLASRAACSILGMPALLHPSLPPGVSATRIPEWMLPLVPPAQRALFRPDLLLIPGLTTETLWMLHSATTPAHLRAHVTSIRQMWLSSCSLCGARWRRSWLCVSGHTDACAGLTTLHCPCGPPSTMHSLTLHLVEFSFCNDNNSAQRMFAKEPQHSALDVAGWTVKFALILGSAGTVFHPALDFLISLGVSPHAATLCLRRLHLHAVNT